MSKNLGFTPVSCPYYFFLSYNGDEVDKVGPIARALSRLGLPIWYDDGIPVGENWEETIAKKIASCQVFLLCLSKGLLEKSSYVRKEYDMARDYFDKKIVVLYLDDISPKEVPTERVPWFIEMKKQQGIEVFDSRLTLAEHAKNVMDKLGYGEMNLIVSSMLDQYNQSKEKGEEAEALLEQLFHLQNGKAKATVVMHLIRDGFKDSRIVPIGERVREYQLERRTLYDCLSVQVKENRYLFNSHPLGARDDYNTVGELFLNDELCFHVGPSIEVWTDKAKAYYDQLDDVLYIFFMEEILEPEGVNQWKALVIDDAGGDPKIRCYVMAEYR